MNPVRNALLLALSFAWLCLPIVHMQQTVGFLDDFTSSDRSNYAVTFNVQNSNSFPVAITQVSTYTTLSGSMDTEVWFRTAPVSGITDLLGHDGWTQAAAGTAAINSNVATMAINVGSLVIPPNGNYGLALRSSSYLNTPIPSTIFVETVGGVTMVIGGSNSYAADPCCTLEFSPRAFWGPTVQPSSQPSLSPTFSPSARPSASPSASPSVVPSSVPTDQPSCQPSKRPIGQPTGQPSSRPSSQPSSRPSGQPMSHPSSVLFPNKSTVIVTVFPSYKSTIITAITPSHFPTVLKAFTPSLQSAYESASNATYIIPNRTSDDGFADNVSRTLYQRVE
eukprot:gene33608-40655_t